MDRRWPGALAVGTCLLLGALVSGCGEAASELGRVPAVARSDGADVAGGSAGAGEGSKPPPAENIRRGGEGPESILEFGLFGPVVPTLESDGYYASDCRFENDAYETCL